MAQVSPNSGYMEQGDALTSVSTTQPKSITSRPTPSLLVRALRGQKSLGMSLVATDNCPSTRHGLPKRDIPSGYGQGRGRIGLDCHVANLVFSRQATLSRSSVEKYHRAVVDGKANTALNVAWRGYGSERHDEPGWPEGVTVCTADHLGCPPPHKAVNGEL